ncbi:hypothetical protein IVB22_23890 [Bradyrhizobium sp. 190]|uniref:hypothetical protein n=1 Tax=Bradyrhizobium sp. 190 TaxID=2782658 RepID=UPI001FF89914|nr:hypothetical protein [Bradyrhizobium sp. 190]MCK1515539.1 hypothetical protein [Bradyrhizobium sp. 190]
MMRVGLIVVGLSALIIMELGTPPRAKTGAPDPFEQLTADVSVSADTLETADRLEIHRLQQEASVQPTSPAEPTLAPDVTAATTPETDLSTVRSRTDDKKHVLRKLRPKPKYTEHNKKPKPKPTTSNKAARMDRSKAMVEVKPCRPYSFDSLLQALNLSSRCQT